MDNNADGFMVSVTKLQESKEGTDFTIIVPGAENRIQVHQRKSQGQMDRLLSLKHS